MKYNTKILITVAAVVFAVVAVLLGVGYSSRAHEKARLREELATVQTSLNAASLESLADRKAELTDRLEQIAPDLESAKSQLGPIASAAASSAVFEAARKNGLTVGDMSSSDPSGEQLAGITLTKVSMTIGLKGKTPDIVNFVRDLGSSILSGTIELVEILSPGTTGDNTTARVELAMYAYQGGY